MRSKFSFPVRSRLRVLHLVGVLSLMLLTSTMLAQTVTTVLTFYENNGMYPNWGWTQGRDGRLYGTTNGGPWYGPGSPDAGEFARFDPSTLDFAIFRAFTGVDGDGLFPTSGVTLGSDNYFYGTTPLGGAYGYGVLYKITMNGTYTVLHEFTGGLDGAWPSGPPIEAADGNFYGTTSQYGYVNVRQNPSTVYKLTRDGVYNLVYSSTIASGTVFAGLIQGGDGKLYVTASAGGTWDCGKVAKIALYGKLLATDGFYCADGLWNPVNTDGQDPVGALTMASDGSYYGVTLHGGTYGKGTLFQLTPALGKTVLYNFGASQADGILPDGNLVQGTDGNLYGTTHTSNDCNWLWCGPATLFQWSLSSGYRQLYVFPDDNIIVATEGGLMQHTNGLFYGQASSNSNGSIFSLDMGLGPFVALVRPQGKVGSNAQILGQGLIGTSSVTFNGIAATSFNVVSDTYMTAVAPTGATTGPIVVTTPTGSLKSNRNFTVP